MLTLFDFMRQAQNGAAFDALSRQFALSPDETRRAVEALLPAFSLGFLRNAQHPNAFGHLLGLMSSGQYAPFFDMLPAPQASASGDAALGQLFGSPEVARQVAAQASAMTGIGADVLRRMLPILAGILVGGLSRFASVEGFAGFLRQWSDALLAAQRGASAGGGASTPFDPLAMWRSASAAAPSAPGASSAEGLTSAWTNFMGAMMGGAPTPPAAKPPEPGAIETMFKMFETGQEVQTRYLDDLRAIFDRAWATKPGESAR